MPDKKSSGGKSDEEEKKGGLKLPVVIGLCVVLLGAGYFVGGMMGGAAPAEETEAEAEATDEEAEIEVGKVIDMEAVNINLAEGHYLRVAVSLGLDHEVSLDDGHGKEVEFKTAPAADLVLRQFVGASIEELSTIEGRDEAREALLEKVSEKYDGAVVAIYFTEFVMQ
ncbi:MAG: flagellar basal body-associated protein FliL [Ilumatobacter sp.]|jgi:flagellar protein FliL|uniref:flagellar basal body-associated FliL family protein n=1 Tax=Ilumatobacter sp. TaxID=1967498 RepID=UPI00391CDF18